MAPEMGSIASKSEQLIAAGFPMPREYGPRRCHSIVNVFLPVPMIILEVEQEQSPNRHQLPGTFPMSEVLSRDTAGADRLCNRLQSFPGDQAPFQKVQRPARRSADSAG